MKIFICAGLAAGLLGSAAITVAVVSAGASAQAQETASRAQVRDQIRNSTADMSRDQVRDHAADRPADQSNYMSTPTRLLPGDRVGEDNRHDRDIVVDWETYNLKSPPSGYSWLRHDGSHQYLLTEMQTGRIVDAVDQAPARPDRRDVRLDSTAAGDGRMHYADGQKDNSHDGQPSRDWSRGDRVPDAYRDNDHTVSDWRDRNLRAPVAGYSWIRNDNGQYVLANSRSGRISDVVDQDRYRSDYTWNRGDRLSGGYLDPRFTVTNWRSAGLPRPARGQHWVRINGHFMLTSVRTGMVSDIRAINR